MDDTSVERFIKGLNIDVNPIDQPKYTYRFALNSVIEPNNLNLLSNERGNTVFIDFDNDYNILGGIYVDDNEHLIFLIHNENEAVKIYLINTKYNTSKLIINDPSNLLTLNVNNIISGVYRLRHGCDKTVYFVDKINVVRTINLSNNYNNPISLLDLNNIVLIKNSTIIPKFESINVVTGGATKSGTYNFAIQYVDSDKNQTSWLAVSMTVPINATSNIGDYDSIMGSSNAVAVPSSIPEKVFGTQPANKRIEITLSNLDTNYTHYRFAVICATSGTGFVNKVLVSYDIPISNPNFMFDGYDDKFTEMSVEEIILSQSDIGIAKYLTQVENRLLVANTESSTPLLRGLQKYASRILSKYVVKQVDPFEQQEIGNSKCPETYAESIGYMAGEVYAFGIVYIFENGIESPAYHIPGRPKKYQDTVEIDTFSLDIKHVYPDANINIGDSLSGHTPPLDKIPWWKIYDTSDDNSKDMSYYELNDGTYDNSSYEEDNYWGSDSENTPLNGQKIRHHKFPSRYRVPLVGHYSNIPITIITVNIEMPQEGYINDEIAEIIFDKENSSNTISKKYVRNNTIQKHIVDSFNESSDSGDITINPATCPICQQNPSYGVSFNTVYLDGVIIATPDSNSEYIAHITIEYDQYIDNGKLNVLGIKFDNIDLPEGAIGYRIVRAKRNDSNKTVLAKGFSGTTRTNSDYISFNGFSESLPHPTSYDYPFEGGDETYITIHNNVQYIFTPDSAFLNKDPIPSYLKVEGQFLRNTLSRENTDIIEDINDESLGWIDNDGYDWSGTCIIKKFKYESSLTINRFVRDIKYLPQQFSSLNFDGSLEGDGTDIRKLYNCTVDNKVAFANLYYNTCVNSSNPSTGICNTIRHKIISYVALMIDKDVYPILEALEYYNISNNAEFPTNLEDTCSVILFGGDTFISSMYLTSAVDQLAMQGWRIWDFIIKVNIILLAAAVAIILEIVSFGTSTAISIALLVVIIAAIAITVSIEVYFAAKQAFYDELQSNNTFQYMIYDPAADREANPNDDTFYAFLDHSHGLFIESDINVGLREQMQYGFSGVASAHNMTSIKHYTIDKFLMWDKNSARYVFNYSFKPEIYRYNLDYSRHNEERIYFPQSPTYDINSKCINYFPDRIYYSNKSGKEDVFDAFGQFLPLNYIDVPGEHGEITNIFPVKNALFAHTTSNLWYIPKNTQERITGDIVSLVGTGGFFATEPIKVKDINIGSAGSSQDISTIKTDYGVFFISDTDRIPYLLNFSSQSGTSIKPINNGMNSWFLNNTNFELQNQLGIKGAKVDANSPIKFIGFVTGYDNYHNRLLLTKKDYKILPDKFTILILTFHIFKNNEFIDDDPFPPFNIDFIFSTTGKNFWFLEWVSSYGKHIARLISFDNTNYFENKSWTLSYTFTAKSWTSYHSYLPSYYIYDRDVLISTNNNSLWKHNTGSYQTFYEQYYPHIIDYVSVDNPTISSMYNYIEFITEAIANDTEKRYDTFNKIIAYNSYQSTGLQIIKSLESNLENDYLMQSVLNTKAQVIIKKVNKMWRINDLRDYVKDYNVPLFTSEWNAIKDMYYIDKIINDDSIDFTKDWSQLQALEDRYLRVRLYFDDINNDNIKLITNFTLENKSVINT